MMLNWLRSEICYLAACDKESSHLEEEIKQGEEVRLKVQRERNEHE